MSLLVLAGAPLAQLAWLEPALACFGSNIVHCGHVGCCDNSPNRHATAHWHAHAEHPLIRSYEPGEDWWWCYVDEMGLAVDGPSFSHP
mgnify:CR=1 FL=1